MEAKTSNIYVLENINLLKLLEHAEDLARRNDHLRHVNMPSLDNLQGKILIGKDNTNLIPQVRMEHGPSSAPSESLFKIGWTISGHYAVNDDSKTHHSMPHTALFCSNGLEQDNDLNEEVSHWWKAESMPLESKASQTIQKLCWPTRYLTQHA